MSFMKSPPPLEAPPNDLKPPEVIKFPIYTLTQVSSLCSLQQQQAEELLKRMASIDGNKSAVRDVASRQKIASIPSDLYDPDILSKLTGKSVFL